MSYADCSHTRIMYDCACNMWPIDKSMENIEKVSGLANEPVGRRVSPGHDLLPSLLDRCRPVTPNTPVGDHA